MMKAFWSNAAQIAAMAGVLLTRKGSRADAQAADASRSRKHRSFLACNVLALSSDEGIRHFKELGPALVSLTKSVRELDDGFRV
jgi:hypothetical protein